MAGYIKIPAPPYELCPKCGAANHGSTYSVWRVADNNGGHGECDVCSHVWQLQTRPPDL